MVNKAKWRVFLPKQPQIFHDENLTYYMLFMTQSTEMIISPEQQMLRNEGIEAQLLHYPLPQ